MFMLSFIFVIVCGLFEWKLICVGFIFRLFINVLPLEIPLTGLTPPHVYACLKAGPEFPTLYLSLLPFFVIFDELK